MQRNVMWCNDRHLPVANIEMLPSTWPNATLSRCRAWHRIWHTSDEKPLISLWLTMIRFSSELPVLHHIISGPRFPINAMPEGLGKPHVIEHGMAVPPLRVTLDVTRCSATFQIITNRSALVLTITSMSCGHQATAVIVFLCSDWMECNRYSCETASHCNKQQRLSVRI